MTVLPFCEHVIEGLGVRIPIGNEEAKRGGLVLPPGPFAAKPAPPPQHHLLLLTSRDTLSQAHVLNLLRDTYHEVCPRVLMQRPAHAAEP